MKKGIQAFFLLGTWLSSLQGGDPISVIKSKHILKNGAFQEGAVWFQGGKIISPQPHADQTYDVGESIVSPGLIDLHCNGALGYDFSQHPEKLPEVASFLPQTGVTSFLAGLVSSFANDYQAHLPKLNQAMEKAHGAKPLGIHLEGPFIHVEKKGMHKEETLPPPPWSKATFSEIYGSFENVKLMTLAPEHLTSLDILKNFLSEGIQISIGHSTAEGAVLDTAFSTGVRLVTHLFNAMPPLHHREQGIISRALTTEGLYFSLICDGFHLSPATIRFCFLSNPQGIFLVTDSSPVLGMPDGSYSMGGQKVELKNGKTTLEGTQTLAGGAIPLNKMVKNFSNFASCPLEKALLAASERPAEIMGWLHKGALEPGFDADIAIFDSELNVEMTFIEGKLFFSKKR